MITPNTDRIALSAQADFHRLVSKVIPTALAELQPVDVPETVDPMDEATFFAIAAATTHNALCQEARKAFALMMGATFERLVRWWLAQGAPHRSKTIQKAQLRSLFALVLELKGVDVQTLSVWPHIIELWEVVSALRHGDGRATKTLSDIAPHLWPATTIQSGQSRIDGMVISDADINRYYDAAMMFWGAVGATPPLRSGA